MLEKVRQASANYDLELVLYGILLIAFLLESVVDSRARLSRDSLREAGSNLIVALLHNLGKYIFIPPLVGIYRELFKFRILDVPWTWWGVIASLIAVDFIYYAHHRSMHRFGILWTVHAVHHQPRFVNLSMSTRLSFFNKALTYWFYLPLAVFGVPISILGLVGLVNGLYQALTHSRFFRLPLALRFVFIDSRDHHLHHSRDEKVYNLNYGGMLSVWDRIFGTRPKEELSREFDVSFASATILYGLPGEAGEARVVENPLVANLAPFRDLWRGLKSIGIQALIAPPRNWAENARHD